MAWIGLLATSVSARAEEVKADGRFVPVPANLTGESVELLLDTLKDEIERFKNVNNALGIEVRRAFKIVFDFNSDNGPASSAKIDYCRILAEGIRELSSKPGVQTLAFVHGDVSRHSVLPVLACQKIIFSAKATLGPVLRDETPIGKIERTSYQELAVRLLGVPDLLEKLFDRDLTIVPSKKGGWVKSDSADAAPGRPLFESGKPAQFNFAKAKDAGLCEPDPREDRKEIVDAYNMLESTLRENPLLRGVVAARIPISGEVNGALKERLERRIRRATGKKANLIVLELRCRKGDTAVANSIAEYLLDFNKDRKDRPVEFIAYVTPDAEDTAAYIALGCTAIVMDPKASLGGFGALLRGKSEEEVKAIGDGMARLAQKNHYSPDLARAFVDRTVLQLLQVTSTKGARRTAIFTGRHLDEERNKHPNLWGNEVSIDLGKDGLLTLNADDAVRYGIAYRKGTFDDIRTAKGIRSNEDVFVLGEDWLDDVADFLRTDWVQFMLVMIGITCLMLELKMPGVGLPGILAALCFVLFFWSKASVISGQLTWLAVLLFLLGLILLGLEIFVLPGFGVCGISGIVLVLGSLALASYGKWPQDGAEWVGLSKRVAPFGLSLLGSVVLAVILVRYLPSIPYINRILLKPHAEEGPEAEAEEGPRSSFAALLGAIGVAATPLRPAGKVQFGDQFVDVVAEGSYVVPGTRVQVIEIEGNRVVVKAV